MKTCPHCSSTEIDRDPQQGVTVCMGCGTVLEDQLIVSEVQFQETASGGVSVVGQHLSAEGGLSLPISGILRPGFGRESQEATFQRGKRRIQQIASRLRLSTNCSDMAFGLFKLAVRRRFTRGRRTAHVVAACMYIACRDHNTPHMLLDFSDVLRINVYVLGKTYLQLARMLCISVHGIDPCLLIHRFANRLEFGDKENEVAMTALRLVARMKRDWMDTGRRPSGLCGAALFVASRIHNFSRTIKDIICVVKVCESTVKKRLHEFEETPTSQLTVDEFHRIDLEEAADPPAFTLSRRKAKEMQLAAEQAEAEEDEDDDDVPSDEAAATMADDNALDINEYSTEITSLSEEIDQAIETRASRKARILEKEAMAMLGATDEAIQAEAFVEQMLEESIEQVGESHTTAVAATRAVAAQDKLLAWTSPSGGTSSDRVAATRAAALRASSVGPRPSAMSLGIGLPSAEDADGSRGPSSSSAAAAVADKAGVQQSVELDLTGIDDSEIDQLFLSEDEIRKKTVLWMELNCDYLKEQEEKAKREAEELQSKPESARKKRKYKKRVPIQASTAGEAIEKMVLERKMSSKINYEVLKDLGLMADTRSRAAAAAASATPDGAIVTASPSAMTSESVIGSSSSSGSQLKRKAAAMVTPPTLPSKKATKELAEAKPSTQRLPLHSEAVVETAPLPTTPAATAADYNAEDDEDLDEDFDEDEPVSAVRLFQQDADGFDEDDYGEDYE